MSMLRHNSGKPEFSYLPNSFLMTLPNNISLEMLLGTTRVLEFGAKKYSPDNWRKSGSWRKATDSALRHLLHAINGEKIDPESGLYHMDHFGCNLAFLIEFATYQTGTDDRFIRPADQLPMLFYRHAPLWAMLNFLTKWLEGGDIVLLQRTLETLNSNYMDLTQ